jgi:hypothetical protein
LNNFFIENSFKEKEKIIGEIGHALGITGKPSVCTLYSRQFEKN